MQPLLMKTQNRPLVQLKVSKKIWMSHINEYFSVFNDKDFNGSHITVTIATPEQKQPFANKLVNRILIS